MKNTRKQTKQTKAATTVVPSFPMRSARVKLDSTTFGERFLGGEDFCVFSSEAAARQEIELLKSTPDNARVVDTWEIHVWRGDAWVLTNAGVVDHTPVSPCCCPVKALGRHNDHCALSGDTDLRQAAWPTPFVPAEADDDDEPEGCDDCMTYPCTCDTEEEIG